MKGRRGDKGYYGATIMLHLCSFVVHSFIVKGVIVSSCLGKRFSLDDLSACH